MGFEALKVPMRAVSTVDKSNEPRTLVTSKGLSVRPLCLAGLPAHVCVKNVDPETLGQGSSLFTERQTYSITHTHTHAWTLKHTHNGYFCYQYVFLIKDTQEQVILQHGLIRFFLFK